MRGFIRVWATNWCQSRQLIDIAVDDIVEVSAYANYENDEERENFTEIAMRNGTRYLSDESVGSVRAKINSASEKHEGIFKALLKVYDLCMAHNEDCKECPLYSKEISFCNWEFAFKSKPCCTNIWSLDSAVTGYEEAEFKTRFPKEDEDK